MIGIKVQNLVWEKALLDLFANEAEKYQEDHTYDIVISQGENIHQCSTLILGRDIPLPFSFSLLTDKINKFQEAHFENNFFKWLPQTRQLIHKINKKIIQLTEKESQIIEFLAKKENHSATREEILRAVWHYQDDVCTHTLESHIYALRQKVTPDDVFLITLQNGIYSLI